MPAVDEAKYSADQLRDMLGKGQAIKNDNGDPSYPIGDAEDLGKAISAVGRGGKDHDKIRAYIVRRAKALGKTDMLPDGWNASGAMKETAQLAESSPLTEATRGQATGARMRIKLIDRGWGSSGYYGEAVLRRAAADRIFPAGTQMFLDHPAASEAIERPERSVRDLAAVLTAPASYQDGGLYAEARVFGPYQQLLTDMAEHIGVSIRACGTAEHGEVEGREGAIITGLTEGISVDFVTKAGRGGQIVEVLEAARKPFDSTALTTWAWARGELAEARSIGGWLESRLHCMFTEITDGMYGEGQLTREERIGLSSAIGDALGAFVGRIETDHPQLYQRDITDGPPEPGQTSADMAETITPAPPAQPLEESVTGSAQPGTPPSGAQTTEVSEAATLRTELAETKRLLADAELKITQHGDNDRELAETKTKLAEADRKILRLEANSAARDKAVETLAESTLPDVAHARVIASVTGDNVPLTDEGALDEAALVKNIKAAIDTERSYLTSFAESAGIGQVRGLGGGTEPQVDVEGELGRVFANLDMSESAAKTAAKGRA
ncbi:hypothetical protein [Actinomadura litoris]|uniref:hypothetical protein n=1 Tax=Actinomadura litoris TaxID=2678616 RepID=UPI001FA7667F|nr:hypothetical protein [Actinomadura litoris]